MDSFDEKRNFDISKLVYITFWKAVLPHIFKASSILSSISLLDKCDAVSDKNSFLWSTNGQLQGS